VCLGVEAAVTRQRSRHPAYGSAPLSRPGSFRLTFRTHRRAATGLPSRDCSNSPYRNRLANVYATAASTRAMGSAQLETATALRLDPAGASSRYLVRTLGSARRGEAAHLHPCLSAGAFGRSPAAFRSLSLGIVRVRADPFARTGSTVNLGRAAWASHHSRSVGHVSRAARPDAIPVGHTVVDGSSRLDPAVSRARGIPGGPAPASFFTNALLALRCVLGRGCERRRLAPPRLPRRLVHHDRTPPRAWRTEPASLSIRASPRFGADGPVRSSIPVNGYRTGFGSHPV
jgi:hypothetical protein